MAETDSPAAGGVSVDYTIDTSKLCPHGMGNINTCGLSRNGSMFPYCAHWESTRCPQIIKKVSFVPFGSETQK